MACSNTSPATDTENAQSETDTPGNFDLLVASIGPDSTKKVADALLFSEKQENILWRAIFKSDEWIDKAFRLEASLL